MGWSSGTPATSEPPVWTLREELRLGAAPGPGDDLSGVHGLAVARNGTVYVASRRLTIFVPGEPPRRVPAGPNDSTLRFVDAIGLVGDTLWVFDPTRSTVMLLGSQGNVIRSTSYVRNRDLIARDGRSTGEELEGRARAMLLGDGTFAGLLADHSILRFIPVPDASDTLPRGTMLIVPGTARRDTSVQPIMMLVRASPSGQVLQGLEMLVGPWTEARVPSPYGRVARVAQPFHDHPLVTTTPDGAEVIVVERYGPVRPGRATYSIARFDVATGKRLAHRYEYQPVAVTRAAVDTVLRRMLDTAGGTVAPRFVYEFASPEAAAAAIRAVIRHPAYHTPITDVVAGADRSVWVRERSTGRWVAHARDGRVAGSLALPASSRLLYADDRVVWTAERLPGGSARSETVVRHRIVRP